MISFVVDSVPVAQPRQRHSIVAGHVHNYTPKNDPVMLYKSMVKIRFLNQLAGAPMEGPLAIDIVFVMPRPKYLIWKKKPMPRLSHDARPDIDNLLKSTFDALKGIAWRDDTQIAKVHSWKCYAAGDEQPHAEIKIWSME